MRLMVVRDLIETQIHTGLVKTNLNLVSGVKLTMSSPPKEKGNVTFDG